MSQTRILLTDALSERKIEFSVQDKPEIILYLCGITPYSFSHLGHGRSSVAFDFLVRTLKFVGFKTTYLRNITDIDDKLLQKAQDAFGSKFLYKEVAAPFILDFRNQMARLNCLVPDREPLATESITAMVDLIKILLEKGFAYRSGNDINFDSEKFEEYGKLSKKDLKNQRAGARIALDEGKRSVYDFVLWKGNSLGEFWDTEIGFGRPGWHIECSAMIFQNTPHGTVDIHGGGADLIFPHHENEIAQSEAALGLPLANCWIHNGLLNVGKEKMSKSLANSFSLKDFFEKVDPNDFRFYCLQHNIRAPLEFCDEKIADAAKLIKKMTNFFSDLTGFSTDGLRYADALLLLQEDEDKKRVFEQIMQAILDDLNSAKALGILFKHLDEAKQSEGFRKAVFILLKNVFGLRFEAKVEALQEIPEYVQDLISRYHRARSEKDWAVSDVLREEITKLGFKP